MITGVNADSDQFHVDFKEVRCSRVFSGSGLGGLGFGGVWVLGFSVLGLGRVGFCLNVDL